MSTTFDRARALVRQNDWRASDHAIVRMAEQGILGSALADRIDDGVVVEDYPSYHAGPCVLVLHYDEIGPVHAVWGIEKGTDRPAVLVTAYRPDPTRWQNDYRTRKP